MARMWSISPPSHPRPRPVRVKSALLQPEVGDLVVVRQAEMVIDMLQQPDAGERNRIGKLRRKFWPGSRRA